MAIQTRSLSAVEHDFYVTNVPGDAPPANIKLNEAKKRFYNFYVGSAANNKSVSEGEKLYLKKYTASASNSIADLWVEMAALYGISTTKKTLSQIKYEIFIKNSPEP
jgi:hypothetical protein